MPNSLRPHGLQHTRLPCPSPSSGACSNSSLLSRWCHPIILSSVAPFSSYPQPFSASGSFPTSQLLASAGQSIAVSASVLSTNIPGWVPLGLTGWSPCCPGDSQKSSPAPQFESIISSVLSLFYGPAVTFVYDYWKDRKCRDLTTGPPGFVLLIGLPWWLRWWRIRLQCRRPRFDP